MKILSTLSTGVLLAVLSLPAFAASCPKDMKKVDAALADNPSLSAAGDHAGSVKDLHKALDILGVE